MDWWTWRFSLVMCLLILASIIPQNSAIDLLGPVDQAIKDPMRLPCDTVRHVKPGEKLFLDSTTVMQPTRNSRFSRKVAGELPMPPPLMSTYHGDGGYVNPIFSRNLGSYGINHQSRSWRTPTPEICHWSFTSDPTCQLTMHTVYYRRGDPRCSKQYLLLSDNSKEIQVCGSSMPPYVFVSENYKLNIKFFRRPYTYRTIFEGYVSCDEKHHPYSYYEDYYFDGEYKIAVQPAEPDYPNEKYEDQQTNMTTTPTPATTQSPSDLSSSTSANQGFNATEYYEVNNSTSNDNVDDQVTENYEADNSTVNSSTAPVKTDLVFVDDFPYSPTTTEAVQNGSAAMDYSNATPSYTTPIYESSSSSPRNPVNPFKQFYTIATSYSKNQPMIYTTSPVSYTQTTSFPETDLGYYTTEALPGTMESTQAPIDSNYVSSTPSGSNGSTESYQPDTTLRPTEEYIQSEDQTAATYGTEPYTVSVSSTTEVNPSYQGDVQESTTSNGNSSYHSPEYYSPMEVANDTISYNTTKDDGSVYTIVEEDQGNKTYYGASVSEYQNSTNNYATTDVPYNTDYPNQNAYISSTASSITNYPAKDNSTYVTTEEYQTDQAYADNLSMVGRSAGVSEPKGHSSLLQKKSDAPNYSGFNAPSQKLIISTQQAGSPNVWSQGQGQIAHQALTWSAHRVSAQHSESRTVSKTVGTVNHLMRK